MANTKKYKQKRRSFKNKLRKCKKTRKCMTGGEKSELHTNQLDVGDDVDVDASRDDPENVIRVRRLEEIKEKYQTLKNELHSKQSEKEEVNNNFNKLLTDAAKEVAKYKSMSNGEEKNKKLSELQSKYANLNKDKTELLAKNAKIDEDIQRIQEEINKQLNELTILVTQILES